MMFDRGAGRIMGPFDVDSTGQEYVLFGETSWLAIALTGSLKMYMTQDDFNNDRNYWSLQGDSASAFAFEAPVRVRKLWFKADATAEVTILAAINA